MEKFKFKGVEYATTLEKGRRVVVFQVEATATGEERLTRIDSPGDDLGRRAFRALGEAFYFDMEKDEHTDRRTGRLDTAGVYW